MILSAPLSPALGLGGPVMSRVGAGGVFGPNPNLLLWSEALDNPVWAATGVTVTPNTANDPNGQTTADLLTFAASGTLRQVTPVAAVAGAAVTAAFTTDQERPSVSGTFDGTLYVFSFYPIGGDGTSMRLRIDRSGGFLRVSVEDIGDAAVVNSAWMKLEAPLLSAYVKREGT